MPASNASAISRAVFVSLGLLFIVSSDGLLPSAAGDGPSLPPSVMLPILVTGMVHIDPLPVVPDVSAILAAYEQHRDGWMWYLDMAERTGLRLSAQMTGVYAEACLRQGHASDFSSCMPGGPHNLGTHLHANVKGGSPYVWETAAQHLYHDPATVRRVLADNIPWVNAVFQANGFSSADNWFFHASQAGYPGMARDLLGAPGLPYDNRFIMADALRGRLYLYRGGFHTEPHQDESDVSYIKMPEVGGIIGEDRLHGPEGMVYGSVPYQRRDFLRAYIEWREMARRGARGPVRHFNWMIHPYQLTRAYQASDGRSPREAIAELVAWLKEYFIGKTDDTGLVTARFANAAEIREAFESWERLCPEEAAALREAMGRNSPPRYLPSILDRLETTFHRESLTLADGALVVHRLADRESGKPLYLVWTGQGRDFPLAALRGLFPGRYRVYKGGAPPVELSFGQIPFGVEPVLLEGAGED